MVSSPQNGQPNWPPAPPPAPASGTAGHSRTNVDEVLSAAVRFETAAELLDTYAEAAFDTPLDRPGLDPVSTQVTSALRARLDAQRLVARNLAAIFRQNATAIRKGLARSQGNESELDRAFRGDRW